jgi:hypothetical protein
MNADLRIFRSTVMLGLVALFVAMASAAHAANVTGTWLMAVKFGEINGTPTFVLSQQGDKVTGTFKGQLGEANVIGAVTGNAIKLSFKTKNQGQDLDVVYSGTLDGDSMSGKVEFVGAGEGTFTGKKK